MSYKQNHTAEGQSSRANSPLAHLYPVPDPLDCDRAWEAYYHADLCKMTLPDLKLARARLMMRLAAERNHHPWLIERLKRLEGRIARER